MAKNNAHNQLFYVAVLLGVVFAVYFPILGNDFLYYWDDQWQVLNRYTEGGITFSNLWAILTEFYGGQYSPVNQYMYLLIYSLFGYNPAVFHLASLLLHVGCVCLVYLIVLRVLKKWEEGAMTTDARMQTNSVTKSFGFAQLTAWVTALLFAVHPMNVESVAWISASKIVVYAFFYLAATYMFIIYLERKKLSFYILTVFLFLLSFGGKEQAITFPVWLILLCWLFGRSFKERKVWMELTPFFLLSIALGIVTMLSQAANGGGVLSDTIQYPLWQRFVLCSFSLGEYIVKFTFPYNLLYIYPFPMLIGEPLPAWMLLYPALTLIVTVTLWEYIKKMPVAVGLLFFLIHIALALHVVPLSRFVVIADRYIYLACIGLSFIVAYYFIKYTLQQTGIKRKMMFGCFSLIILFLGVYSNLRCRDWKDTDSIKREIRELIRQRADFVPEEFEQLLKDEKNGTQKEN